MGRHRILHSLTRVRCRHGSLSLNQKQFQIGNSILRVNPTCRSHVVQMRFFNSRVSTVHCMSPVAKTALRDVRKLDVCPTGRFIAPRRQVRRTYGTVRRRLTRQLRTLRGRNGLLRTRHLRRHAHCSLRVVHRINCYGNIRGCTHRLTKQPTKSPPRYLLSCFPRS